MIAEVYCLERAEINNTLVICWKMKDLHVKFDSKLKFADHINEKIKKADRGILVLENSNMCLKNALLHSTKPH